MTLNSLSALTAGIAIAALLWSPAAISSDPGTDQIAAGQNRSLTLEPCHIRGLSDQIACGTLQVPENYDQPDGKQIELNIARIPSVSHSAEPDPVLFLAGGPGQAATELAPLIRSLFRDVLQTRDVILVDQRGTGKSNPLQCDITIDDHLLIPTHEDTEQLARDCAAELDADFQQYTTVNAVRDFERVREALGYSQFNLYGGSYGTRSGLVYLREYPDSIRSAVLDGLAPTQVVIGLFGQTGTTAFHDLLQDCESQRACNRRFGNLHHTWLELKERLEQQPQTLTLNDPRSHEPTDLALTDWIVSGAIRHALYSPRSRQLVPLVISEAHKGNFSPLAGLIGSFEGQSPLYMGLTLSVLCQEDMPRATDDMIRADGENDFLGGRLTNDFAAMCRGWPVEPTDIAQAEPVHSEKPVLLLSGAQDPVTPPAWGELAKETLPNSWHLVAEHGSHTILTHTCANRIAARFYNNPQREPDASCLSNTRLLPFIRNVNAAGM